MSVRALVVRAGLVELLLLHLDAAVAVAGGRGDEGGLRRG